MSALPILTILKNGETVKAAPIEGEAVLGRGEGCLIRLDDKAISRQHAVFRRTKNGVQVEKKSEFAPLLVNGADCTSALLKEGDVVAIGPYLLKLQLEQEAKAEKPQAGPSPRAQLASAPQLEMTMPIETPGPGAATVSLASGAAEEGGLPGFGEQNSPQEGSALDGGGASGVTGGEPGASTSDDPFAQPDVALGQDQAFQNLVPNEGSDKLVLENEGEENAAVGFAESPAEEAQSDATSGSASEMMASSDDATRLLPSAKLNASLKLPEGAANVTELRMEKTEIVLGRDASCDLVLNEKKASRKHAMVIRSGAKFLLKDLASVNGTSLNGKKISGEVELVSGDVIRIGSTEIAFAAESADYARKQPNFLAVEVSEEAASGPESEAIPSLEMPGMSAPLNGAAMMASQGFEPPGAFGQMPMVSQQAAMQGVPGVSTGATLASGIPGVPGLGTPGIDAKDKPKSLIGKGLAWFRGLEPRRQAIWGVVILAAVYFFFIEEDDEPAKKPKKPKAAQSQKKDAQGGTPSAEASGVPKPAGVAYEALPAEKKRFVESQHELGFNYYKNKEYDKAIYEINQIFTVVPDYKDSKEIVRYAQEAKQRQEAFEAERRKKVEEEKLKKQVEALIEEIRDKMTKKQYVQAKELFGQLLAIDPENGQVNNWKKEIEDYEEALRKEAQIKEVQKEKNRYAWDTFNSGLALKKQGKCRAAIPVFRTVPGLEATDRKPAIRAKAMIEECRAHIAELRDPLIAEGKAAEDGQDFPKAFAAYKKASQVDPDHKEPYAGMDRIRKVLHDRAKISYTEAIIAESYSDFATAKKKFKETMSIAPEEDIYHERAQRKLSRYPASKSQEDGQ